MFDGTTPMSKVGEFFLLQRSGVSISISCDGLPKLKSRSATLFLTTSRLVLVPKKQVAHKDGFVFKAFEIPLDRLHEEKFNQPLLGANNLSGSVEPTPGSGLDVFAMCRIYFNNGGAGTFLPMFFRAVLESRRTDGGSSDTLASIIRNGGDFNAVAVVDPSDPSKIYLTQPDVPVATTMTEEDGEGPLRDALFEKRKTSTGPRGKLRGMMTVLK